MVPFMNTPQKLHGPRLRSSMADEPGFRELLDQYVDELPAQVERIETALSGGDLAALRRELHDVRGTAGGFGYRLFTDHATELNARAASAKSMAEVESDVCRLVDLLRSVEGFNDGADHPV
jgi:HPt (histidine-containing phosphotransfer) domain-containing protein